MQCSTLTLKVSGKYLLNNSSPLILFASLKNDSRFSFDATDSFISFAPAIAASGAIST